MNDPNAPHRRTRPRSRRARSAAGYWMCLAAAAAPLGSGPLDAQSSSKVSHWQRVLCSPGLTLVAASGVPDGATHGYAFQGSCRVQDMRTKDGADQVVSEHVFPVELKAVWNASQARLTEAFVISTETSWNTGGGLEPVKGSLDATYTCVTDPVVAPAKCSLVAMQHTSTLYALGMTAEQGKPVSSQLASLAAATQLSAAKSGGGTTPPPPPEPTPTKPKIALKSGSGIARMALRAPGAGDVASGSGLHVEALLLDDHARQYRVDRALLEWQVAIEGSENTAAGVRWQLARVLGQIPWNGADGRYLTASADVPRARLDAGSRWRVRALSPVGSVQPSDWVEFTVPARAMRR